MQHVTIQTFTLQLQNKFHFKAIQYGMVLRSAIKTIHMTQSNII